MKGECIFFGYHDNFCGKKKKRQAKNDKYENLIVDGYLFQPLSVEIQKTAGLSTQTFVIKRCKNLSICTEEPRACSFLKQ